MQPPRGGSSLAGLSGYRRIVDDIVIYDQDITKHADHVRVFLQRCADMNITLNMEKCKFRQTEVSFLLDFVYLLRATESTHLLPMPYTNSRHPQAAPICAHFWVGKPAIYMQHFHGIVADSSVPIAQYKE